jgi:hypothetical protein
MQSTALFWEGEASYWKNQYCNKGKSTASERALKRLDGIRVEDSQAIKVLENRFKEIK